MSGTKKPTPKIPEIPLEGATLRQLLAVIEALFLVQEETGPDTALNDWVNANMARAEAAVRAVAPAEIADLLAGSLMFWTAQAASSHPAAQKARGQLLNLKEVLKS